MCTGAQRGLPRRRYRQGPPSALKLRPGTHKMQGTHQQGERCTSHDPHRAYGRWARGGRGRRSRPLRTRPRRCMPQCQVVRRCTPRALSRGQRPRPTGTGQCTSTHSRGARTRSTWPLPSGRVWHWRRRRMRRCRCGRRSMPHAPRRAVWPLPGTPPRTAGHSAQGGSGHTAALSSTPLWRPLRMCTAPPPGCRRRRSHGQSRRRRRPQGTAQGTADRSSPGGSAGSGSRGSGRS